MKIIELAANTQKIELEADVNCFWEDKFSEAIWLGTSLGLMKASKKDILNY